MNTLICSFDCLHDNKVLHYCVGDLIHAEENVFLDHILKPVGQQAGKVNGYRLSGLGLGIQVQGMSFKVNCNVHNCL